MGGPGLIAFAVANFVRLPADWLVWGTENSRSALSHFVSQAYNALVWFGSLSIKNI
jgi:hypothetical protein